jgi:hypothetical protein
VSDEDFVSVPAEAEQAFGYNGAPRPAPSAVALVCSQTATFSAAARPVGSADVSTTPAVVGIRRNNGADAPTAALRLLARRPGGQAARVGFRCAQAASPARQHHHPDPVPVLVTGHRLSTLPPRRCIAFKGIT